MFGTEVGSLRTTPERITVGQALRDARDGFAPDLGSTPLNRSFDLSVGGRSGAFDEGEFGYFLAGSYSDTYSRIDDEIGAKVADGGLRPGDGGSGHPQCRLRFREGHPEHRLGRHRELRPEADPEPEDHSPTTVNLNTDDEGRTYFGENGEDIGGMVRNERSRFVQRLMIWGQLSGEHRLFWDSKLDWRATLARADRDEPFLRETIYLQDNDGAFRLLDFTESGRYFWSELIDDDGSGEFDWRFPFSLALPGRRP